ncbi:hypothetical protein [Kocuria atrinae]|uniref:hypothetical protein n=1 Tax=Kocuria atrinae TaxID=592377 RepID=UPI00030342FA|nr:hypothetical protein [Kocuria atrinae]
MVVLGLFGYAVGVGVVGWIMIRTGMRKLPEGYMGWSVASGIAWLFITVVIALVLVAVQGVQMSVMGALTIPFVAGFLLQTLLGAMSYILPSTMGGGPATVRASLAAINRGGVYRVTVLNLCITLFALPAGILPSWVRAMVSIVGAVAFAAFIPLMISSAKISVAGRRRLIAQRAASQSPDADTADAAAGSVALGMPGTAGDRPPLAHPRWMRPRQSVDPVPRLLSLATWSASPSPCVKSWRVYSRSCSQWARVSPWRRNRRGSA